MLFIWLQLIMTEIMMLVITSLTIAVKFLTSLSSRRLSRSKASAFSVLACVLYSDHHDYNLLSVHFHRPCSDAARQVWRVSGSPPSCSCPSSPSAAASRSSPNPQTSGFLTPVLPPGGQSLSLSFLGWCCTW